MSWKLLMLAITVVGLCDSRLLAGEQGLPRNNSEPQNNTSTLVSVAASAAALSQNTSDEELIAQQKICPVTGLALGSMGKPVKLVVKQRVVFLCCAGCEKKFLADPEKYLKKLDEKK